MEKVEFIIIIETYSGKRKVIRQEGTNLDTERDMIIKTLNFYEDLEDIYKIKCKVKHI